MSDAVAAIRMMLANNMGRPLEPSVLIDQLSGTFSASEVRASFWRGRASGELDITEDYFIALPAGGDR